MQRIYYPYHHKLSSFLLVACAPRVEKETRGRGQQMTRHDTVKVSASLTSRRRTDSREERQCPYKLGGGARGGRGRKVTWSARSATWQEGWAHRRNSRVPLSYSRSFDRRKSCWGRITCAAAHTAGVGRASVEDTRQLLRHSWCNTNHTTTHARPHPRPTSHHTILHPNAPHAN